ncbi:MAG: acetate--CoA ligase family protein [Patescibacteria group bacterium]
MNSLKSFFNPRSVAIIGASNHTGKVGNDVIKNLLVNYRGEIFPINPSETKIEGKPAYSSILKTPQIPDLAIIVVPAQFVLAVVEDCGKRGTKNILIISSGFKEVGGEGVKLEEKLLQLKNKYKLRILGPNCLGYINTKPSVNASFAATFPKAGNVAFFSQSGALGTAILDTAEAQKLGFSYFVSMGNKCDINELDLLEYFNQDKNSKVIMAYLESINDGQKFLSIANKISDKKPIIVLKSGKTADGSQAVSSHTGSLAGTAQVYSAAFKQSGVIEARDVMDFFNLAEGFAYQDLPRGNRVAIVTNAGGPGILLTDWLPDYKLKLAELSETTKAKLKKVLPAAASNHNPVDVLGDALADRYEIALREVVKDKNVDAIIVALTPQRMTQIKETAEAIGRIKKTTSKTIVLCFLGELEIVKYYQTFADNKLPQFNFPEQAVSVLSTMAKYYQYLKNKQPTVKAPAIKPNKILSNELTEDVCRQLLIKNDIPVHRAEFIADISLAAKAGKRVGYPIALKVISPQVIHKSDVGGVKVGINNETELLAAIKKMNTDIVQKVKGVKIKGYLLGEMVSGQQVIVGLKRDPQFGAVIMLGLGGIYTEVFKDVVFRVAPINKNEAQKMIEELKIYPLLAGTRGQKPADIGALADLLVRFSCLVAKYPELKEIDFNPIMVLDRGRGVKVVDVRMAK